MSEVVGTPESGGGGGVKEQERFLPIANIGRIMQRSVLEKGKITKDAKESIQECVSEFISFITTEASDKCMKEKCKTINGDDLIWSMGTLGFEDYVEPLKLYWEVLANCTFYNCVRCCLSNLLDWSSELTAVFVALLHDMENVVTWQHVWSHFCLCFKDEKMTDDKATVRAFGIKDGDEL
ncbi:nuclear transcription factor Y subunit B-4-like [Hordeum vulgare subsp. vulgare]|uniref:nuclear transcription factor Y subunit B-4-like n=1 Tax=Hordeum vulgare subsp. vulgare TaxID=112509 RepID=UPI001D1A45C7|nr:nuclear transcription factor Y subunit B-4-like [Hordeum vulgare subsp. vulgare]